MASREIGKVVQIATGGYNGFLLFALDDRGQIFEMELAIPRSKKWHPVREPLPDNVKFDEAA